MTDITADDLVALTADLTAAHLSNNEVSPDQIPGLIRAIHDTLAGLGKTVEPVATKPTGAVTARKSLADPARILSMIDGKPYTTLKRHLGPMATRLRAIANVRPAGQLSDGGTRL